MAGSDIIISFQTSAQFLKKPQPFRVIKIIYFKTDQNFYIVILRRLADIFDITFINILNLIIIAKIYGIHVFDF